jgi:hypothetical protein
MPNPRQLEALGQALVHATWAAEHMEQAHRGASPIEGELLRPMLADAVALADRIRGAEFAFRHESPEGRE